MFRLIRNRSDLAVLTALLVVASLLAGVALLAPSAHAQQPPTPSATPTFPIVFSGPIESVGPRFIVVNGLLVDLAQATVPQAGVQLGATVTVSGSLSNSLIVAARVELGDTTGASGQLPSLTPVPTATLPPVDLSGSGVARAGMRHLVIQGPVTAITPTTLRIFNLDITYDPTRVDVTNIQVGDNVRVEGDFVIANNTYTIVAIEVALVNTPIFRDSSVVSQPSDRVSDRDSAIVQPAQPPPPPPPPSGGSDSAVSGRDSVSAASGRGS